MTGTQTTSDPDIALLEERSRVRRRAGTVLRALRPAPPRIGTTLGLASGTLASLAPGLLPRTPGAQAILTGLLAACGLGIAGIARFLLRHSDFDVDARYSRVRLPVLSAAAILVVGAAAHAGAWQNRLRAAMKVPLISADYWLWCALGATVVVGVAAGIARGAGWVLRALGTARGISLTIAVAALSTLVGVPMGAEWRASAYANSDAYIDPAVAPPISFTRSGSAESEARWTSLGAEGRRFVSGAPARPVRVYVGIASAPDLDRRVALAVRELRRAGGFERSHLVVAVPTGSGWIDGSAVEGLDRRFDGDVALVGLQYSYLPSWAAFLFAREDAVTATRALFAAVEHELRGRAHPPKLYLYGQSLGALGGSAVFGDDAEQDRRTCAVLWAGPPGNRAHRGGATVLANSSDPVIHWSPAQLWRPPDLTGVRVDAPVPRWLPVISFAQTTADLLAALDAPPGHGHRYGTDQGTSMGGCGPRDRAGSA